MGVDFEPRPLLEMADDGQGVEGDVPRQPTAYLRRKVHISAAHRLARYVGSDKNCLDDNFSL